MIVDFDDFHETNHRLDLLEQLHQANPAFRCTLFAVPGLGTDWFWESVPEWCELAVHGYLHPDPYECTSWSVKRMEDAIATKPPQFVDGFKAPGWQISDGCYAALHEAGWWVADHYDNDARRPGGIRTHVLSPTASSGGDPGHWHGHIQNVCGNGLEETFDVLIERVRDATSLELISEAVQSWQ